MWILLTRAAPSEKYEQKALFNINNYDCIYGRADGVFTILEKLGCKEYDMVQETPEQIQQKIDKEIARIASTKDKWSYFIQTMEEEEDKA